MVITIKSFLSKEQNRIAFVQALSKFGKMGLKNAKLLQDQMLDGDAIIVDVDEDKVQSFIDELNRLNMDFTTT